MKNILLAFCLFFGVSASFSQSVVTFRDDFNDNKNNWAEGDNPTRKISISWGEYCLDLTTPDEAWYYWRESDFDASKDHTIEASIKILDGNPTSVYGLIWGAKEDVNNFTAFRISGDSYCVGVTDKGTRTNPIEWTAHAAIKPMGETNTLKIVKTLKNVSFFVNDVEVGSMMSVKLFGNYFGFIATDTMRMRVDHLEIRQPSKPTIKEVVGIAKGVTRENLGAKINSDESEICPVISPDGSTLYICRYSKLNMGADENFADIYHSQRAPDGSWNQLQGIGTPLNNTGNNTILAVLPDNNTLLCLNTYDAQGNIAGGGLSFTNRTATGWSIPTEVKFVSQYKNISGYSEYSLGPNGNVLIMAIHLDTTAGGRDLYVSFKKDDGIWTDPTHMGFTINSPANDIAPFLAADNSTLYFSTNGRATYGSNDIFMSRRLDDSWMNWSEPENLGPEINSPNWDSYFTLPASGEYAYISSSLNSLGEEDIIRIKLPDAVKPTPLFLVSGRTFNAKTKQPIDATIKYETLPDGSDIGTANSSPGTGDYKITLARGKRYGFRAEKEGFFPVSDNLDATKLDKYTEVKKDLYLVPVEVGEVVRINNVFFDFAKFELRPESYPDLNRIVSFLKTNATVEIQLLGHTDNVGKDGDNIKLSENRIQSVKSYLVAQGVDAARMSAKGYGKSRPIATNDTEEGRQENRRVEFTIVKK